MRYNINIIEENLKKISIKPVFLDTVDSTNYYAKSLLKKETAGEFLILSEEQTGGRGRLKRKWYSPKGKGIWMSLVKENFLENKKFGLISILTSLSVFNTLYKLYQIKTKLKWPNDVLYNNKKICGILIEGFRNGDKITHFIIGIGINIYQDKYDYPDNLENTAVSLIEILSEKVKREQIITCLISEINSYFDLIKSGRMDLIIYKWKRHSINLGRQVFVKTGRKNVSGRFINIDIEGNMVIKTDNEKILKINSGEVVQVR